MVAVILIAFCVCSIVGYLSFVLGASWGFQKGLALDRDEVEASQEFAASLPHRNLKRKQFAIIPSRREKAELDEEEAIGATPESWRKNHLPPQP